MTLSSLAGRAALAVALAGPSLAGCHGSPDAGEDETGPVVTAATALVTAGPFDETITAIGTVVPRAGHFASLSAPAPTRVMRVRVTTGQRVTRGQTLIELDQTTFQAAVDGAEAALQAAEQAHARAARLADLGVGPRKDVEQAASELARARADAVAARRAVRLAVLRAPIAGVVTRMDAALGASVDANQPLVEIADVSALDLVLDLTPAEAARVRIGVPVAVMAGPDPTGESLGTGRVVDVSGIVDSTTRSVAVRAALPAASRPLRLGETVFARIVAAHHPRALTVPVEALVPEGDGFKVFVVDSGGMAHARPVVVGARSDSVVEIRTGLAAGDRVVTSGAYGVTDSAKVVSGARPPAEGTKR